MDLESNGGFWDGFFDWEIWNAVNTVWTNASAEHPTFVFIVVSATILTLGGGALAAFIMRSRQNHEYRSRQQFIDMKRENDANRDRRLRLIVKNLPPEELDRIIRENQVDRKNLIEHLTERDE